MRYRGVPVVTDSARDIIAIATQLTVSDHVANTILNRSLLYLYDLSVGGHHNTLRPLPSDPCPDYGYSLALASQGYYKQVNG